MDAAYLSQIGTSAIYNLLHENVLDIASDISDLDAIYLEQVFF